MKVDREKIFQSFEFWCKKLRVSPYWDIHLEFVDDTKWRKTGDFKIDCDDRKAVLYIARANSRRIDKIFSA